MKNRGEITVSSIKYKKNFIQLLLISALNEKRGQWPLFVESNDILKA